jgi:hypothetical protein
MWRASGTTATGEQMPSQVKIRGGLRKHNPNHGQREEQTYYDFGLQMYLP